MVADASGFDLTTADAGNDDSQLDLGNLKAHEGRPGYPGSQAEILRVAMTTKVTTVLVGRDSGKTIGLFLLFLEEGRSAEGMYEFGYVAQGHSQAAKFYRMVKRAFEDAIVAWSDKGQDRWLEIAPFGTNEGAIINFWAGGEEGALDNVRGPRLNRLAVDEAGMVHRSVVPACMPMLRTGGRMIFVGTARRGGMGTVWFKGMYDRGVKGEQGFRSFNFPSECNPYKAVEDVAFSRRVFRDPNFPDVPTSEEREEHDGAFLSDIGAFFRNLDKCITLRVLRNEPGLYIGEEPIPERKYVLGQDFGKKKDHSVSAVFDRVTRNMVALRIEPLGAQFGTAEVDGQLKRIDTLKRRYNDALIIADPIGVGSYIAERLKVHFGDRFRELAWAGRGANSKEFHMFRVRQLFDLEGFHLLNVPEVREQFEAFQQVPIGEKANGYYYEAPSGKHDDVVAAVALASSVLQIEPAPKPRIVPPPSPLSVEHFAQLAQQRAFAARRVRW